MNSEEIQTFLGQCSGEVCVSYRIKSGFAKFFFQNADGEIRMRSSLLAFTNVVEMRGFLFKSIPHELLILSKKLRYLYGSLSFTTTRRIEEAPSLFFNDIVSSAPLLQDVKFRFFFPITHHDRDDAAGLDFSPLRFLVHLTSLSIEGWMTSKYYITNSSLVQVVRSLPLLTSLHHDTY